MDCEVLVVGAGPTGLSAAGVLAANGVEVRVVAPGNGPTEESRALIVHARTLELWDKVGLAAPAIAAGQTVDGAVVLRDGRALNHGKPLIDFTAAAQGQTPFPYQLVHEQSRTEQLLDDHLTAVGGEVTWNTEATGIRQLADGVEVTVRGPKGRTETITAGWVIGADGAHSVVRHGLGLGFEGDAYPTEYFLADVALDWEFGHEQLYLSQTRRGTFLFVPIRRQQGEPPRFRVLASADARLSAKRELTLDDVQDTIDRDSGVTARVSDPRWITLYRLHHRVAEHFRVGRVFLAGDAGHIHSPVGGQGMNTGIQDAHNLAWKLAAVVRGQAQPGLLDSYEAERHPVAQRLVHGTDQAFDTLTSDKPTLRAARTVGAALLPTATKLAPALMRRAYASISQLAISYAGTGPTVHNTTGGPGLRAGDRAPYVLRSAGPDAGHSVLELFTGTGHHLLVLPATAGTDPGPALIAITAQLDEISLPITLHVIDPGDLAVHQAYGATQPTMMLIRPDGYLAWRGTLDQPAALGTYLHRWYLPAATVPA